MGMLEKKGYLDRVRRATALDRGHPRHGGVTMQAHHVVSAKGVDLAGESDELRGYGYDINALANLVFLPSTLQGACHLEVQLHRGNHPRGSEHEDAADDDDAHSLGYHRAVDRAVRAALRQLRRRRNLCSDNRRSVKCWVNHALAEVSADLLEQIRDFEIPLTTIHGNFAPRGPGCKAADGVAAARTPGRRCLVERNHQGRQAPRQRAEGISLAKPTGGYRLRVGR